MIPGWTHNIINLSDTEDLVTVMTCNEIFNPGHPDTFLKKYKNWGCRISEYFWLSGSLALIVLKVLRCELLRF